MANYCQYNVIVKGKKNACYAYFGSMSCLECKDIYEESGTYDDYTIKFTGNCKWSVDCYCTPWEGEFPVVLPEDPDEAYQAGEDEYWYNTVQERSKMFEVEVWCNSADIEDYDVHPFEVFEHYICGEDAGCDHSGCNAMNLCPEELRIYGDSEQLEGDCCMCVECGYVCPKETCHEIDDGMYLCDDCYNNIDEGCCRCVGCGDVCPQDECFKSDNGAYFCSVCHSCIEEMTAPDEDTNEAETSDVTSEESAEESAPDAAAEEIAPENVSEAASEIIPENITTESVPVTAAENTETEAIPEAVTAEPTAEAAPETVIEEASEPQKRGKAWIIWLVIAAVIIALAAVYIFCEPAAELVNSLISQILEFSIKYD